MLSDYNGIKLEASNNNNNNNSKSLHFTNI